MLLTNELLTKLDSIHVLNRKKKNLIIDLIRLDEYSFTPKYLQIANSVKKEIENGSIKIGQNMPSINELSLELDIAKDTVERSYKLLKDVGIVDSVPRRGYFIRNSRLLQTHTIFLLFNKLSVNKEAIYDSFTAALGSNAVIDFYIYNSDFLLFKRLLSNKRDDYTHYVIIPHFIEWDNDVNEIINAIPKDKLLLLDRLVPGITGEYAAVYENFEKDIYNALAEAMEQLSKYKTLKIIFPEHSYYPPDILRGFKNFCQDHAFAFKIVSDIIEEPISAGEAYISVSEAELVTLIERINYLDLKIGEQVGIISYNETPFKKIILNGITTISADFHEMGLIAADLILSNSKERIEVPFKLTLRNSL